MRIFIVANFTNSETSRFFELARMFANRGHDVTVVTSDFLHSSKSKKKNESQYDGFKTIYLHEPGYRGNVTLKRLYSHYVWGKNVTRFLETTDKPDIIYCAIPSLTAAVETEKFCKRKNTNRWNGMLTRHMQWQTWL